jgi:hypothetical protein
MPPQPFDDLFSEDEFVIDPDDLELQTEEKWDTGISPDIFASGSEPDIFNTKGIVEED